MRSGSGMRASAVGASSCTMWPRKDGISTPSTVSVGDVRALASWPAKRPTFTTGSVAPYVSTAAIWSMIFSFSRMWTADRSWNDSAHSPAWSRKARPAAASAREACSWRASPAKTSGGTTASRARAASARSSLGHSGWWSADFARHEEGVQTGLVTAMGV